jgi:hypothetical protein
MRNVAAPTTIVAKAAARASLGRLRFPLGSTVRLELSTVDTPEWGSAGAGPSAVAIFGTIAVA